MIIKYRKLVVAGSAFAAVLMLFLLSNRMSGTETIQIGSKIPREISEAKWEDGDRTTSKLGDSGRDYLGRNLQHLKRNAIVVDVWQDILPQM